MGKDELIQRVLNNPKITIYGCGRQDIQAGTIDRRVLATLEFLVASGFNPTISSLQCGHSFLTASGNVSEHSVGSAVDIAAINGEVIKPSTQGKGSITERVIQSLLTLQGNMKPHQIISLMKFEGADNTLAMGDHDDHIHVGFEPQYGANSEASQELAADSQPVAVGPPDRASGRDREPGRPAQPVEGRPQGRRPDRHRLTTPEERRFRFVQWEFPGRLGPPPGRYVVRRYAGDAAHAVVVVGDGTAPRRVGRRESRDTVPVTKVTVIDADPIFDDATAADWLRGVSAVPDFAPPILERLVASFRAASGDPFLADFDVTRAWRTRVGYGSGDQVAEGEWTDARDLDPPAESRHERRSKHRQTDRFVALLVRPRRDPRVRGADPPRPPGPHPRPAPRGGVATRGGAHRRLRRVGRLARATRHG